MIQLGSGGIDSDPMGKTKALTRLKDAENYPIWWLRFVPMARARGFDRILKYREKYIDEIREREREESKELTIYALSFIHCT